MGLYRLVGTLIKKQTRRKGRKQCELQGSIFLFVCFFFLLKPKKKISKTTTFHIETSYSKAREWWTKAAAQGFEAAIDGLKQLDEIEGL